MQDFNLRRKILTILEENVVKYSYFAKEREKFLILESESINIEYRLIIDYSKRINWKNRILSHITDKFSNEDILRISLN
jgi:hypothetical protein